MVLPTMIYKNSTLANKSKSIQIFCEYTICVNGHDIATIKGKDISDAYRYARKNGIENFSIKIGRIVNA